MTEQQLPQYQQPLEYNQFSDHLSEAGSEGSAEMSIELGRGVKRGARNAEEDVSSNVIFNMGGDSLYEVTGTPPIPPRSNRRTADDGLRRQASVRSAAETAKSNVATKRPTTAKHRSLWDALHKIAAEDEATYMAEETAQATATFNARNTRFARSRQTSANEPAVPSRFVSNSAQQTPRRNGNINPTVQSNSFILPDLPNITELVSGVRKDGTPIFNRTAKSHSRFTSASYKPIRSEHIPVESVPIPDEEKAIYASLQLLKDRVEQLEMEKSEAHKRAEEYEGEIIDLRSQLAVAQRRPNSAFGSDEEMSGHKKWSAEKKRLQASVKALQEHLDRSERKMSISEIAVKRMTKERDEVVKQIGIAYYNNEELKAENETFRDSYGQLQAENQDLKDEIDVLRRENQDLRMLMAQTQASYDDDTAQRQKREAELRNKLKKRTPTSRETIDTPLQLWNLKETSSRGQEGRIRNRKDGSAVLLDEQARKSKRAGVLDEATDEDLATTIAQEVRKHREEAAASKTRTSGNDRTARQHQTTTSRSRSKSASRQHSAGAERRVSASKRTVSAPLEMEGIDAESTTELDFSQKSRTTTKRASLPSPVKARPATLREEDSRDLTLLSWDDPNEIARLRKKIEEERRAERFGRAASAPVQKNSTQQSIGLPRKSSLKDVTVGMDEGTSCFSLASGNGEEFAKAAKSVRVQSPHTSDEVSMQQMQQIQQAEVGDTSILSNTSRRRRRAASADIGMTSAFILPDITLHTSKSLFQTTEKLQHDPSKCTACPPNNKDITIPTPVPVTDREGPDVTNATIRPAQPPPLALATVIKQLEDEVKHLKFQLGAHQQRYNQHDPALSKRERVKVKTNMDKFTIEIEKRSDQIYALYDVLEGQKEAGQQAKEMDEQEVEEKLDSLGIDPAEIAARVMRGEPEVGRKGPFGLDGAEEMSEGSGELPWEGLSDVESEGELRFDRRRSGVF